MNPLTDTYRFLVLREQPELKGAAAAWFHAKWGVPEAAGCMSINERH